MPRHAWPSSPTASRMKEVQQVIRGEGAHSRRKPLRLPLGPAIVWRLLSVLVMGLFGANLLAPGAAVAKTSPTALNVVVVGDFDSFGAATSTNAALRAAPPPTLAALNQ